MDAEMFKRMATEGQQISAKFYADARHYRDLGFKGAAAHAFRNAAVYASAARENLFAEIGQNSIRDAAG